MIVCPLDAVTPTNNQTEADVLLQATETRVAELGKFEPDVCENKPPINKLSFKIYCSLAGKCGLKFPAVAIVAIKVAVPKLFEVLIYNPIE